MSFDLPSTSEGVSTGRSKTTIRGIKLGRIGKAALTNKSRGIARHIKPSKKTLFTENQRDLAARLKTFNKTFLILTLVIMLYDLTGQVSAAEAPASAGEIASSHAGVELVKHDPVNFDQLDPQVTKPNVDSSTQPAAAALQTPDKSKLVSAVNGEIKSAEEVVAPPVVAVKTVSYNPGSIVNMFPYGYCTWYVASKRPIPWTGNAGSWYSDAIAYGFKVGNTPAVGAVMVTSESYLGHVAYVEAINPDGSWLVSEMNYAAWGVISSRTIRPGTIPIIGFIY